MATEIIGLDEIIASQAAKEVSHNTALRQLEGRLVRVKSRTTTAQPGGAVDGDTYILPASPTGTNWATFTAKQIAHLYGGTWKAWTPIEGTRVWVNDEDSIWVYNGTDWVLDSRAPMLSKSVAGSSNVTLTEIESRYPAIDMTGAITANISLIVTTTPKLLLVKNSTTGAYTITVKTSAGSGIVVSQGARRLLYCDGTNVVSIDSAITFLDLPDTPSAYTGQTLKFVRVNAGETALEFATPAGSGNVTGPASATDNALVRFDGTTGTAIKDSAWLLDNSNVLNAQDAVLQRPEIKDYAETLTTPSISSGTLTLDLTTGNVFEVTLNANVTTLTLSNPPATGKAGSLTLILKQDATGGRTFAWPAAVKSAGGTDPVISSAANAVDIYSLLTTDGGTTWYVFTGGKAFG